MRPFAAHHDDGLARVILHHCPLAPLQPIPRCLRHLRHRYLILPAKHSLLKQFIRARHAAATSSKVARSSEGGWRILLLPPSRHQGSIEEVEKRRGHRFYDSPESNFTAG